MKARVKATGNIVDVEWYGHDSMGTIYADVTHTTKYYEYELDFDTVYDYWTRLEHTYAGMAMQGICSSDIIMEKINRINAEGDKFGVLIAELSANLAHALVEKMKEKK